MYEHTRELELLVAEAFDEGSVTEVIRPAAVLPEDSARKVLSELALRDVRIGGLWHADPSRWRRFDQPWNGPHETPGTAQLIGSMQVAYGTPTRYDITIYRVTVTGDGARRGWDVTTLCDEALGFANLTLDSCPRADLRPPPPPFRIG